MNHLESAVPAGDAGLEQGSVTLLPDTYSAMLAVVDAARDYRQSVIDMMHVMETGVDAWSVARARQVNAESRMFSGLAALDKAQAAQPEGEQG